MNGPEEAKDENVREMMTVELVETYMVEPQMAMKINTMLTDTEAETKVKSITPVTMTCLKCEEYGEKQHEYTIAIVVYQKVLTKEIWEQRIKDSNVEVDKVVEAFEKLRGQEGRDN